MVIIPIKTPFVLTTGTTDKSYFEDKRATSSWSSSGTTEIIFVCIKSCKLTSNSFVNKSRISIQPINWFWNVVTKIVWITSVFGEISLNFVKVSSTVKCSFTEINSVVIIPPAESWGYFNIVWISSWEEPFIIFKYFLRIPIGRFPKISTTSSLDICWNNNPTRRNGSFSNIRIWSSGSLTSKMEANRVLEMVYMKFLSTSSVTSSNPRAISIG